MLDTNVLSEAIRPRPDPAVLAWLDQLPDGEVATTAVTVAELRYGVARLADGRRRSALRNAVEGLIVEEFRGRVAPFDAEATAHYATIVADRERAGQPISTTDAQIAAICRGLDATLATRNTRDFAGIGLDLVDPWTAAPE